MPSDGAPVRAGAPAIFAYDGSAAAGHALATAAQLLRPRLAIVANVWQTVSSVAREGAGALDEA